MNQRKPTAVKAKCHPDREHKAKGLCCACYMAARYRDPVTGPKIKAAVKNYQDQLRADPELHESYLGHLRLVRKEGRCA